MEKREVLVPVAWLLDPAQPVQAKVVWMGRCLRPAARPAELQSTTGLSRHNVQSGLAQLAAATPAQGGARALLPAELLAERSIGAQAKVLYGILQATPAFRGRSGQFTYAELCAMTRLGRNTLKRAMADLVGAGWVQLAQAHRLQPIRFTLGTPELQQSLAEVAVASRRLERTKNGGEAIMQEILTLLIDSAEFTDNARPGFLVNPQTQERLELDRFYPPDFAVEFNGAQHYRKTGRFTQQEADAQHFRDLIKAGLCLYRGIDLVIIHPEDLSVQGVARKIGRRMPLRDLTGHERLIDLLDERSLIYRAAAAAAAK